MCGKDEKIQVHPLPKDNIRHERQLFLLIKIREHKQTKKETKREVYNRPKK